MMTETTIPKDGVSTEPAQRQDVDALAKNWVTLDDPQAYLYRCEVRIIPEKEGGYSTYIAELAGVVSQGDTLESATNNIMEALISCLRAYNDNNMPIPWTEPSTRVAGEDSRWVEFNV